MGMYISTESGLKCVRGPENVHEYPWMLGPLKHLVDWRYKFSIWTPDFAESANWVELFDPDFQGHITKTSGHCAVSLEHGGLTALVIEDRAAYFDVVRVLGNTLSFFDKLDEYVTMLYRLENNAIATTTRFIAPLTGGVPYALMEFEKNPESERPEFPTVTVCGRGEHFMLSGCWDETVFDNDEPVKTVSYEMLIRSLNQVACPELVLDAVVKHGKDEAEIDGIDLWHCVDLQ